jgi:hypothetical protein
VVWLPFQNPDLTDTTQAMTAALLYPIAILIQHREYSLVLWHAQNISGTGDLDVEFWRLIFWHLTSLDPNYPKFRLLYPNPTQAYVL